MTFDRIFGMHRLASKFWGICIYFINLLPHNITFIIKWEKTMRRRLDLYIPRVKQITYGERSFKFEAPSLWNSLPLEIRGAENLKLFKYLMKTWTGPSCRCSSCAYNQNGNNVDWCISGALKSESQFLWVLTRNH